VAPSALARQRVVQVGAGAGDNLNLRGDQLTRDVLVQDLLALRGGAQLLKARLQVERARVEDRELLLDAHRHFGRRGEGLLHPVEVETGHRSGAGQMQIG
jgi:hypothetical protein